MKTSKKEEVLLKYKDVLRSIKGQENHLLLGNGFNRGLGVNTSYSHIFEKMMVQDHGLYKDAKTLVEKCNYDLEIFIGRLIDDIDSSNVFLRKYVRNKIKLDFIKATHDIVKSAIKNVYTNNNEGIYLLFQQFTNYFTLNYDSFLYLLLLNYKSSNEKEDSLVFEPSLRFIEDDLNTKQNNIYSELKNARENGTLVISGVENNRSTTSFLNS